MAALSLLALCVLHPATGQEPPADRPHIILFLSDDHSWADSGVYGNPVVRTPHIDRLAGDGMRFTHAFAGTPSCTPSRAVIYTGLMSSRNGSMANKSPISEGIRTLPHYFRDLGYRVVLMGKHMVYPADAFPFEYHEASAWEPGYDRGLYKDLVTEEVDRLLADHDQSVPLLLIVASHSPHVQWPENDGYDAATVDIPPHLTDTYETRVYRTLYYTDVSLMDERLGAVMESVDRHGYRDRSLFIYASDQGAQWPFEKWNLYDGGIRVPLIARWPGRVAAASTSSAMISLADLLPTFLYVAGTEPPEHIDGRSFLPVLRGEADAHREEIFATHTGDYLGGPDSKLLNDAPMRAVRTKRHKYIRNLKPGMRFETHTDFVRKIPRKSLDFFFWQSWLDRAETDPDAAQRLFRYHYRPAEELYDLESDPHELNNLADDPQHRPVLEALRAKLAAWRSVQGDDVPAVAP